MRRLLIFNVFLLQFTLLALGVTGWLVRRALIRGAEDEVLQKARVMMETTIATRSYTTRQVAPLIQKERFLLDKATDALAQTIDQHLPAAFQQAAGTVSGTAAADLALSMQKAVTTALRQRPRELPEAEFHPQQVPAYAATEIFNYFRGQYPDYSYKEATLNPTNLRDRAADWEADVVNLFRQDSSKTEFINRRDTPTGSMLYIGKPIQISNASCLTCHSTPDKAPPEMIRIYGPANGFGWKMNEVIGAQIVSVPEALPLAQAEASFRRVGLWLLAVFAAFYALVNVAAWFLVRPRSVAAMAKTVAA